VTDSDTSTAPGSILLFNRPRGLSWVISLLTRSPYYHVAIALNEAELIEAMPSGVTLTTMAKKNEPFLVIPPPSKEAASAATKWAKAKIGDGYDPEDLLAIACDRIFGHLHIFLARKNRFTCGEFVATAYKEAGIKLIPKIRLEDTEPADFARLLSKRTRQA